MVTNVGKGIHLYTARAGGKMHKIPPPICGFFVQIDGKSESRVFNKFLTKFQQNSKISTIFPWKICGKFVENVGNVKANAFTHVDITRLGGCLSRSCKGAGSCDFVKELGPAAVKELRFTGAAISSCARICQGAGIGAGKNFPYFYFSPFIIAHFVTFVNRSCDRTSHFLKKKKPQELASPWGLWYTMAESVRTGTFYLESLASRAAFFAAFS